MGHEKPMRHAARRQAHAFILRYAARLNQYPAMKAQARGHGIVNGCAGVPGRRNPPEGPVAPELLFLTVLERAASGPRGNSRGQ